MAGPIFKDYGYLYELIKHNSLLKPYLYHREIETMGLPLRITFNDKDYIYQILNSNLINQNTTELELLFNGEKVTLLMDAKKKWIQKDGSDTLDPDLIQALGRSVSLRLRM